MNQFVPNDFTTPKELKQESFLFKLITVDDAKEDYQAVIESADQLKGIFNNDWPPADLTFDEELTSLEFHQEDIRDKSSFAYSIRNSESKEYLGCFYIYPSENPDYDAAAFFWIRKSKLTDELDQKILGLTRQWLETDWPFKKVAYPGREIPWEKFKTE